VGEYIVIPRPVCGAVVVAVMVVHHEPELGLISNAWTFTAVNGAKRDAAVKMAIAIFTTLPPFLVPPVLPKTASVCCFFGVWDTGCTCKGKSLARGRFGPTATRPFWGRVARA